MFSTPLRRVTLEEGQPTQEPASLTDTTPVSGSNPS
eukprot:CAMPEP_0173199620 /NCGR_PEP_ID=MMETSP1141-20130122/17337_1 /TAXON_ID=483371 /ORGANISM="non described non described, Strain CCMP2298" /LENGTH=35 /DNA_ID= /DNA_START= /DNA_END= /DNA_ORIENTATION=